MVQNPELLLTEEEKVRFVSKIDELEQGFTNELNELKALEQENELLKKDPHHRNKLTKLQNKIHLCQQRRKEANGELEEKEGVYKLGVYKQCEKTGKKVDFEILLEKPLDKIFASRQETISSVGKSGPATGARMYRSLGAYL